MSTTPATPNLKLGVLSSGANEWQQQNNGNSDERNNNNKKYVLYRTEIQKVTY